MKAPVRIGIIGMGGFAGSHHGAVARLEERGEARLICTCDPRPSSFATAQEQWRFGPRGVSVFSDYRAMLESRRADLDLIVIPTPIHLHAEMHEAATAMGIPTYLEKPPTLDCAELDGMIRADARARKASVVGFNFIIEKPRLALKVRLISGEFGSVRGATLGALWPRPVEYFLRNEWVSRLFVGGRPVLDSCFGNAMAHFVHNMLFWVGSGSLFSWSQVAAVRAELYRAHAIEGADTFFVEADTASGATVRLALSHACSGPWVHAETVVCEKAAIRYVVGQEWEVRWNDGRVERGNMEPFDGLAENHLHYYRYLRGENQRPATTLTDSKPFVALNSLAYLSSNRISPIPPGLINRARDEKDQKEYLSVSGIGAAVEQFLTRGIWPGPSGWNRETGDVVTPGDLIRLPAVLKSMTTN